MRPLGKGQAVGTHGKRRSRTTVARVLTLLVAVTVLALAACGGSGTTTANTPSATTATSAAPAQSATPLPAATVAGTIAFARVMEPGVNSDIYVVSTDGTDLKQLTDDPGEVATPAWSPDGRRIVYAVYAATARGGGGGALWVMNAHGSDKVKLTRGQVRGSQPEWSPDGELIVFAGTASNAPRSSILVMRPDGSGLTQVMKASENPVNDSSPAWAPNGEILFLRLADVFAVRPDGSGLRQLTKNGDIERFALSADGKKIVIQNDAAHRIETIPVRGAGAPVTILDPVSRFTPEDSYLDLSWAPDGKAMVFVRIVVALDSPNHGSPLYIVNADGTGLSAVPGVEAAVEPAWRPR